MKATKLKGVSTKYFIVFKRFRELYENQIVVRNRELGVKITPKCYRASIDESEPISYIKAGWVKETDRNNIK